MKLKKIICLIFTIALAGCANLDQSKVNFIHTNKYFISQYSVPRQCIPPIHTSSEFDNSIEYIRNLKNITNSSYIGGNSLTVLHDDISYRWSRLLALSYTSAAENKYDQKQKIINLLIDISRSYAINNTLSINDIQSSRCYANGNTNSLCARHTPQHYSFMYSALIISGILVKDSMSESQKSELSKFFQKIYNKYIQPFATNSIIDGGYYEFGAGGIGVIAYADFTNDKELIINEFKRGKKLISKHLEDSGYINNNSYRGVRAYFYHTLGADSMLSYAILMRAHGYDIFSDEDLVHKFSKLAEKTLEGQVDYEKFISKGNRGHNLSTDMLDERRSVHSMAKNLKVILNKDFNINIIGGGDTAPVNRIVGFNADCIYE